MVRGVLLPQLESGGGVGVGDDLCMPRSMTVTTRQRTRTKCSPHPVVLCRPPSVLRLRGSRKCSETGCLHTRLLFTCSISREATTESGRVDSDCQRLSLITLGAEVMCLLLSLRPDGTLVNRKSSWKMSKDRGVLFLALCPCSVNNSRSSSQWTLLHY